MSLLSGINDFFGLDIGSKALRVVQLSGGSGTRSLLKYGIENIEEQIVMSDAPQDQQALANAIKTLITQAGIKTKNVAVGLPASKVFTTVAEFDNLRPEELAKTIQYQVDSLIPTPVAQSKIDWAMLGVSPVNQAKVEVLLSSISNDFIEARLDMLEGIGLNVIAFEPAALALARALTAPDSTTAQMIVDMGNLSTDIVATINGQPHLVRSIPTGTQSVIRAAMQNLNIDEKQARQFVFKFGLGQDKIDGQVYNAIFPTIDVLITEIDKTLKYFTGRYASSKLDRIILSGDASVMPEFPLFIANRFGVSVEIGNAWRNVAIPESRQNELAATAYHFAIAAGLAERVE